MARANHPDRVDETQKAMATEKFKAIHLAYSVLADPDKKKAYDEGDATVLFAKTTIAGKWDQYIHTVDSADIESARSKYQGSAAELNDVMREILVGKGSINHLINTIPFMRIEDEIRIVEMIKGFIRAEKIPKMVIRKIRNNVK